MGLIDRLVLPIVRKDKRLVSMMWCVVVELIHSYVQEGVEGN